LTVKWFFRSWYINITNRSTVWRSFTKMTFSVLCCPEIFSWWKKGAVRGNRLISSSLFSRCRHFLAALGCDVFFFICLKIRPLDVSFSLFTN
jgi:hypothetical protein